MALTRRYFFGIGSGAVGLLAGRKLAAQSKSIRSIRFERKEATEVFAYGVASGDPLADRVILWTQVAARGQGSVNVMWQAALDPEFQQIVSEGSSLAEEVSDYTVKIDAKLPFAATTYYYRFNAHGVWSTVGRTRTAPLLASRLRFAVLSCSSIWSGYFNGYERLAKRNDIDLIVHCGDYIYDVPDPDELRNMPYHLNNAVSPTNLHEQRQRYRYYRTDPFLRGAHQQHPFAVIWDNHDIKTKAPVSEAIQAFFEWQPVRQRPEIPNSMYRTLEFGSLVKFILLDTRHVGRGTLIPGSSDPSLLGEDQFEWLKQELRNSSAQWNVIVNQVLFVPFTLLNLPLSKNSWQGYPRDAERLKRFLLEEGISNPLFVTGDAHLSFASNVRIDDQPVGVEFLPSSLTRGNLDETLAGTLSGIVKGLVESTVRLFNPHIRYFETEKHGYGLVDIREKRAVCEFWYVDSVERSHEEACGRAISIEAGARAIGNENAKSSETPILARLPAPAEKRLYEKGFEVGGKGGDYFDGEERIGSDSRLSGIRLASDRDGFVKALGMRYEDGGSWQMGKDDSSSSFNDWTIERQDPIRELQVGIRNVKGGVRVGFVSLRTERGRLMEAGKRPTQNISFKAPEGWHIVSFHGRSGASIDKLGPIFAPDF